MWFILIVSALPWSKMRSITSIVDTFMAQSFATYRFERNPVFFQTCPNVPRSLFHLPPVLSIVPTDSLKLKLNIRLKSLPLSILSPLKKKKKKRKRVPSHFRFKSFRRSRFPRKFPFSSTIVLVRDEKRKKTRSFVPVPRGDTSRKFL